MRVVSSQHPSITRVMPLSAQTQLFLNSALPNFYVSAQSSPTRVRSKLHCVKHKFNHSKELILNLFTVFASDNLIVILICISKCQKDIFPVQEGVQCRRQLANSQGSSTHTECVYIYTSKGLVRTAVFMAL